MISNYVLNREITKKYFLVSVIMHLTFLIIFFNNISNKKNNLVENKNIITVGIFSPKEKKIIEKNREVKIKEISKKYMETEAKNNSSQNIYQKKENTFKKERDSSKKKKLPDKIENLKTERSRENEIRIPSTKDLTENNLYSNVKEKEYKKKLNDYKKYLKSTIQKEASKNYPKISIRKREQGNVEVIFSLDIEGKVKEITIGKKTNASTRITSSLIDVLKNKINIFEKNEILKKTNIFSLIIVYKLK